MPDLHCPRCGTNLRTTPTEHLIAYAEDESFCPDADVYRCPCGPLALVEGESVTWYAPMAEAVSDGERAAIIAAMDHADDD